MAASETGSAGSPPAQTFATVVSVLVKQILDLRETLEFYERYFYDVAQTESPSGVSKYDAGCAESHTYGSPGAFA